MRDEEMGDDMGLGLDGCEPVWMHALTHGHCRL